MLERTASATGFCILHGKETTTERKNEALALGRSSRFLWGWQSSYCLWCYFEVTVNFALMFSGEDIYSVYSWSFMEVLFSGVELIRDLIYVRTPCCVVMRREC